MIHCKTTLLMDIFFLSWASHPVLHHTGNLCTVDGYLFSILHLTSCENVKCKPIKSSNIIALTKSI